MQLCLSLVRSLSNLAVLLRLNLLTCRDLWRWVHDAFETPVEEPPPKQQALLVL